MFNRQHALLKRVKKAHCCIHENSSCQSIIYQCLFKDFRLGGHV